MSADNYIGICRFTDGWRVARLPFSHTCPGTTEEIRAAFWSDQYRQAPVFRTLEEADDHADALENAYHTEYGIEQLYTGDIPDGLPFLTKQECQPILEKAYAECQNEMEQAQIRFRCMNTYRAWANKLKQTMLEEKPSLAWVQTHVNATTTMFMLLIEELGLNNEDVNFEVQIIKDSIINMALGE
jgi:hypothetical protein